MTAAPKLFTQEELNAKVLEANLYLGENLHEAFTKDDLDEAASELKLAEHERPEGYVASLGNPCVRVPEKIWKLLRNAISADEAEALAKLLIDAAATARWERDEEIRRDAYEMNGAGAVSP